MGGPERQFSAAENLRLVREDLCLVRLDRLLIGQHLIELALIEQYGRLVRGDDFLVPEHLIELALVQEEPGLIPQDLAWLASTWRSLIGFLSASRGGGRS